MRATGQLAQLRRLVFGALPFCFEVEEFLKYTRDRVLKPFARALGLYAILCECVPLVRMYRCIRFLVVRFFSFRWLCDWCPPVILRLRKEATIESEDASAEQAEHESRGPDIEES